MELSRIRRPERIVMTNESSQPTNVGSNDRLGLVARLRQERRPTAWTRGVDTDYPTAWEPNLLCHEAAQEIELLRTALAFYKNGDHFNLSDESAWDTVSGEPQNWWCDEAGTATIEDGSIAKMALDGEITAEQIRAMDEA